MNRKKIWIPVLAILIVAAATVWYVNDYYHSDSSVETYLQNHGQVEVKEIKQGLMLDGPGEETALIFYPGAKVEYTAYLPLLYGLSEEGVDVFLVRMPFNLAFMGMNKAGDIMASYDYGKWYLSGHSLGGAMAASYASKHLEELSGLVLLAAYPTSSLQREGFAVLSIYGSGDGVLNREKLESGKQWLPDAYTELCIEGGNHAFFGNYGNQKGDGEAGISREEQQRQTREAILKLTDGSPNSPGLPSPPAQTADPTSSDRIQ